MKYKLLKKIEEDSLDIGSIIELSDYVTLETGIKIPVNILVEQGYLEELKEEEEERKKPKYKIGDMLIYRSYNVEIFTVERIRIPNEKENLPPMYFFGNNFRYEDEVELYCGNRRVDRQQGYGTDFENMYIYAEAY